MVTIADNVNENVDGNERARLTAFADAPGVGGEKITIKRGFKSETVWHRTYGAGSGHVTIFYVPDGTDFQVIGVGQHAGKKEGKTKYDALWAGNGGRRSEVLIMKKGG